MPLPENVAGVLIDIEGTTTPITFVCDVLFPYAADRLDAYCARVDDDPRIADAVALLRAEHAGETTDDVPAFGDGAPFARWLMGQDRKSTGLKALQGVIWERGYVDGGLCSQVYADVPRALAVWQQAGVRVRVYSSGSVLAQQLLFGYTEHGDLTPYFEGYHDTTTGPKREPVSYRRIAEAFALAPSRILFLSDVVPELDAAAEAGLRTAMLERPGNPPVPPHTHRRYPDFLPLV